MKALLLTLAMPLAALADDAALAEKIGRHQTGSRELSDVQDELAADVQQLTIEQTQPQVIELFREVEDAMDEASERLFEHDTGGATISAETDVIEKIHAAAKAKQQSGGGQSQAGGAMMDMLERMMGKEPGGKPGGKPSDKGDGEGMTGESSTANGEVAGSADGKVEERRVPKGAGLAGKSVPLEFRDALKNFNRGASRLAE